MQQTPQDDPQTVGISVAGTVVEVAVDVAAEACGVDQETLLADWEALGTVMSTMADTKVAADATDLAPAMERGGSVGLNGLWAFGKWISALVTPLPGLASVG